MTTYTQEQIDSNNLESIVSIIRNTMADTTADLFGEPRTVEQRQAQALDAVEARVRELMALSGR